MTDTQHQKKKHKEGGRRRKDGSQVDGERPNVQLAPTPATLIPKQKKKKKKSKKRKAPTEGTDSSVQPATSSVATPKAKRQKKKHKQVSVHVSDDDSDDAANTVPELSGKFVGDTMYLVDERTLVVYSCERDAKCNLVKVGTWDAKNSTVVKPTSAEVAETPQLQQSPVESLKKKTKKKRTKTEQKAVSTTPSDAVASSTLAALSGELQAHAFEADPDDHCETPEEAYRDVVPILNALASLLNKKPTDLRLYDPYFCQGSVTRHLNNLGFPHVHNQNEDFYVVQHEKRIPEHDVLITNPPYSGDHVERLLKFCTQSGKPWLLLIPNWLYMKEYYTPLLKAACARPFYIIPTQRYQYWAPVGARNNIGTKNIDRRTSPFVSFWYVEVGGALRGSEDTFLRRIQPMYQRARSNAKKVQTSMGKPLLARTVWDLPQHVRDSHDPKRKRLRKKQRDAAKRKKAQQS